MDSDYKNKLIENRNEKVMYRNGKTKFVKLFDKEFHRLIEDNTLIHQELAFLISLSKFIGYEDNILKDGDEFLTQKEIANLLNVSPESAKRYFKKLEQENLVVKIPNPNSKRSNIYIVNPLLMYKGANIDILIKDYFSGVYTKRKSHPESYVEFILSNNLNSLEEGMTLIDTQYLVENGRIDILARDKDDVLCIIELKVVDNDYKLINQCVYYPTQFEEPTRMITIAPDYDNKLKMSLQSLFHVETKTYIIDENNDIIIKNYL